MMKVQHYVRWYTGELGSVTMSLSDPEQLLGVLEAAALDAAVAGVVCEVDLWPYRAEPGGYLMVQLLVGHPTASRVIVHEDGVPFFVRVRDVAPTGGVRYIRHGGSVVAEPESLAVPVGRVRGVVEAIIRSGRVPDYLELVEQAAD